VRRGSGARFYLAAPEPPDKPLRRCVFVPAVLLMVVAALALLAAGCGGGGKEPAITPTPTPSAGDGGELTRDQAIERVLEMLEAAPDQHADPSTATARRMTECEALEIMRSEGVPWGRSPNPPSESAVWLVEFRGEFAGFIGFGLTPDPSPPRVGRFVQIIQVDGSVGGAAILADERQEEGPELPRERILERALDEVAPPGSENEPDPSTVNLTRTTYREALETLRHEGAPQDFSERPKQDSPVWLFEVKGEFVGLCPGAAGPGRAFLVLALDGFVESGGLIPDATPTP
jgi:hypothetical protein